MKPFQALAAQPRGRLLPELHTRTRGIVSAIAAGPGNPPPQLQHLKLQRQQRISTSINCNRTEQVLALGLNQVIIVNNLRLVVLLSQTRDVIVAVFTAVQSELLLHKRRRNVAGVLRLRAALEQQAVVPRWTEVGTEQMFYGVDRSVSFGREIKEDAG